MLFRSDVLTKVTCPAELIPGRNSCLLIDGQALVVALGKPEGASNFRELGEIFVKLVNHAGNSFDRVDVVFDRYRETSIKSGTRKKRSRVSSC